jgi:hypothetical protein
MEEVYRFHQNGEAIYRIAYDGKMTTPPFSRVGLIDVVTVIFQQRDATSGASTNREQPHQAIQSTSNLGPQSSEPRDAIKKDAIKREEKHCAVADLGDEHGTQGQVDPAVSTSTPDSDNGDDIILPCKRPRLTEPELPSQQSVPCRRSQGVEAAQGPCTVRRERVALVWNDQARRSKACRRRGKVK